MPTEVILPKVDMDMATGRISRWIAGDGDKVEKGAVLFEIETDKAAMEIDSPASGTLRITVPDLGKEIEVGAPVGWIYAEGEAEHVAVAPAPVAEAVAAPAPTPASAPPSAPVTAAADPVAARSGPRATPLARRLARENGLELAHLTGSGPHGRIQRADIDAALVRAQPPAALAATVAAVPARIAGQVLAAPQPGVAPDALHGQWLRDGQGVPVVLIHGFGAELASWRPLLAEIPADRPVFALDLPGHGKSLSHAVTGFADLVDQVEGALVAHGITAAHLVGHSLGAAVAASVAAGIRLEAASLLLLAPAGLGPDISGFVDGFARATQPAAVAGWLAELVHDPANLAEGFVRAVIRDREDGRLAAAQTRFVAAVFAGQAQGFSIRGALAGVGCETRVVFGTEDRVIPWRHSAGLPGLVGLHVFPQTGHMPQLEQRVAVGQILRQMLRGA